MDEKRSNNAIQAGKYLLGIVISLLEGVAIYFGKRLALVLVFIAVSLVVGPMMFGILAGGMKLLEILGIVTPSLFLILFTLMLLLPWLILGAVYAAYERADFSD